MAVAVLVWVLGVGSGVRALGADRAPALPDDPFCVVTNVGVIVPRRPLPEGTRRMAERLTRIRELADPTAMFYLNDRLVPLLRQRIAATADVRETIGLRLQLGRQLVLAGFPAEGLAEMDGVRALMAERGGRLAGAGAAELRLQRALAYLRLGEQENCIDLHHPDSCVFPIRGGGVHRLPRGSRGAIEVLTEQLQLAPGDLRARWLLNLAYMTLGEWPAKMPEAWVIPPRVFESEGDIGRFPDVAGALGLDVNDLAGGCILDDFDRDGFIDVMASAWGLDGVLRLFRNLGDGRFEERGAQAGFTGIVGGLNIQQTDYNNDGWLDVWILRGAWFGKGGRMPNSLLRNNRDGTFTDVTEEVGLFSEHPTQTSVWFDFDGDGWLDLFIGNETRDASDPDWCELFRNRGDGTFVECARESGIAVAAIVKGVTAGDYDNDGRPDLYVSCLDGPNKLFRNEGPGGTNGVSGLGSWRFRDATAEAGIDETIHSFPTWFFDYDNDGREDLFVSGFHIRDVGDVAADYLGMRHAAAKLRLYRNLGGGRFTNVTASVNLDRLCQTMGSNFGDLDNDGWLDFYLATGDPDLATLIPNRMFRSDGGRRFEEITTSGGFGNVQKGHAVAFADLDNDGDQDVYAVLGGAYAGDRYRNSLFLNPGHGRRWLKLECVGTRSNRAAIGARLRVTVRTPSGLRHIHRTVNSGGSFGSSPLRQEIGLGDATAIEGVEVFWPTTGIRQSLTGLEPDHGYVIREGDAVVRPIALPRIAFAIPAPLPAQARTKDGPLPGVSPVPPVTGIGKP